jgi:excisionase family DNA binding protein
MLKEEGRKENEQESIGIERLLSPKDVAEILGISVKTIHKLVRDGKLGCVQVTARERRFTEAQIEAYIEVQSKEVRVDKETALRVTSQPKKGGDRKEFRVEKTKDSWASLREEMSRWT